MKTKIPELGKILAKQAIVAKTRRVKSSWCMVKCVDGDFLIHVDMLPRYKDIKFAELTCDEAEHLIDEIDKQYEDRT